MTWVILGANGQLGKELYYLLKSSNIEVLGLTKDEIDLANPETTIEKLSKYPAKYLINCAAYTQVDKAEEEIELANKINGLAVGQIAKYALENYIPFVHISTDYVFDGTSKIPYKETDQTNPQSVYGKSKLLGETETLLRNPKAYILRTAWVYGAHGRNFPKIIADKLRSGESLQVVNDQVGSPTWTFDLANAIIEILEKKPDPGIYHVTNAEFCSWFEFAQEIAKTLKIDENKIIPTTSDKYVRPATRPSYSVLSNEKWVKAGLKPLPSWKNSWQNAAASVLIKD
ncbi:MAG: dTDP-4-dehydrorhamnose reductase [Actinomycetes bacterium]